MINTIENTKESNSIHRNCNKNQIKCSRARDDFSLLTKIRKKCVESMNVCFSETQKINKFESVKRRTIHITRSHSPASDTTNTFDL